MQLQQRINAFVGLGRFLKAFSSEEIQKPDIPFIDEYFEGMILQLEMAKSHNRWFTDDNLRFALQSWAEGLSEENLKEWTSKYSFNEINEKTVAIIMAGNIPLVGFHDFLSVLITGNKVLVKLSSNDNKLLPYLAKYLIALQPEFENRISFTEEKLIGFDAVIATGSNNTARYFEYYFGKYPHVIRKNRNSIAVLSGNETPEQLKGLTDDIFRYFGLGCRNVSKIFVPENYDFKAFFKAVFTWKEIIHNNKYINNYDYNKAVYLLDGEKMLDNEFLLLKKDTGFSSPIAVVFYERYKNFQEIENLILNNEEKIQAIVSEIGIKNEIPFGSSQKPKLWDYADGVDTLAFLLKIA